MDRGGMPKILKLTLDEDKISKKIKLTMDQGGMSKKSQSWHWTRWKYKTHLEPKKSLVADIGELAGGNNQPLHTNLEIRKISTPTLKDKNRATYHGFFEEI